MSGAEGPLQRKESWQGYHPLRHRGGDEPGDQRDERSRVGRSCDRGATVRPQVPDGRSTARDEEAGEASRGGREGGTGAA